LTSRQANNHNTNTMTTTHVLLGALKAMTEMVRATNDGDCDVCHSLQIKHILAAFNKTVLVSRDCRQCQSSFRSHTSDDDDDDDDDTTDGDTTDDDDNDDTVDSDDGTADTTNDGDMGDSDATDDDAVRHTPDTDTATSDSDVPWMTRRRRATDEHDDNM
jgi:hypothetical protein